MKQFLFILSLCLAANIASAQIFDVGEEQPSDSTDSEKGIVKEKDQKRKDDPDKKSIKERIYFGGNLGAQFGTNTIVDLSPNVGFKIVDRWSVGVQLTYQYLNLQSFNYQTHIYGLSAFTRVFVFDQLFLHGEYGFINGNFDTRDLARETLPNLYLGGGYRYRIGDHFGVSGMMLFNVLQTEYHPYQNPIVNVGVSYGL